MNWQLAEIKASHTDWGLLPKGDGSTLGYSQNTRRVGRLYGLCNLIHEFDLR